MSETSGSKITRRKLLKTAAGAAAVAGVAGLGIPSVSAQESATKEPIDVIFFKSRRADDPVCQYPGFAPGVRVESGMTIDRDVAVKMRDGVNLYIDIYRPSGGTNLPAIMAWSSGGKQPLDRLRRGVPMNVGYGYQNVSNYTKPEAPDPVYWTNQGYALINPDTRGAYMSEGNSYTWGGQVEGRDAYDVIEWLARRDWSNGKVTMSGNSQLAIWQWFTAAEQPPHLACIAPWEGWTDMYRHIICPGGIPETGFSYNQVHNQCGMGGKEDTISMLRKYPLMNEYWEGKIPHLEKINVPAYITANFKHFHCWGSLLAFRTIPSKDKWLRVINSFEWPDYYSPESLDNLRRFFDHYMKGVENDWELTPRVRLSVLDPGGLDRLNRPEKEWPLARTQYEKLYLDASAGKLSSQPAQSESQTQYLSESGQANFVIRFDQETELTGYLKLRLWVEADGADDLDLFVYVQKLDRKGEFLPSMVLGQPHPGAQGWLRVSHRELDPARSTPSEPFQTHRHEQLLRPKEIVPVEIPIVPTSMVWHPGQQLRVLVASRWMRAPGWFENYKYETLGQGSVIIHTGGKYDSHLLAPKIPV